MEGQSLGIGGWIENDWEKRAGKVGRLKTGAKKIATFGLTVVANRKRGDIQIKRDEKKNRMRREKERQEIRARKRRRRVESGEKSQPAGE